MCVGRTCFITHIQNIFTFENTSGTYIFFTQVVHHKSVQYKNYYNFLKFGTLTEQLIKETKKMGADEPKNDDGGPALRKKFEEIFAKNGISGKISEVLVTVPDLKGEHMGSIIELMEVKFEAGSQEPSLHFFVKKQLSMAGFTETLQEDLKGMAEIEGHFLRDIVNELKNLCREQFNGSTALLDDLFPKVIYFDKEMLIMENLQKRGYHTLSKSDRLDFNHTKTVLENLARLHGVGHVFIEREGGIENFLKKRPNFEEMFLKPAMSEFFSKAFEPSYGLTLEVLKNSNQPEKDRACTMLEKYQGKLMAKIAESLTADTLFWVISHPDCWNNNIMWEGEGPDHDKLIFVDFQMLRSASPNVDIAYFLFTSVKPEVRKEWKKLLKIYFDRVKEIVQSFDQPFEFSFEDFVGDFVKKSKMGFIFGIITQIGFEAIAGHDADAGGTFTEDVFTNLISKWVAANPEKCNTMSASIISAVDDYLQFAEL